MNFQQIFNELNTLDKQNPGSWPLYVRVGAVILVAVVLLVAGTYFLIKPVYEQVGQEEQKEIGLRNEFDTKQKKVAALDAYKAQLAEMELSFGAMLRQLPSRSEVANLLNDISQTRVSSSLEEELFKPQGEIRKEFYAEIPNQIIVIGEYHEMGNFVSGVAALPRIVTIDDVEIQPAVGKTPSAKASKSLRGQLRMKALAKTYRYLDEDEIAAAAAPKKKGKGKKPAPKPPAAGAAK